MFFRPCKKPRRCDCKKEQLLSLFFLRASGMSDVFPAARNPELFVRGAWPTAAAKEIGWTSAPLIRALGPWRAGCLRGCATSPPACPTSLRSFSRKPAVFPNRHRYHLAHAKRNRACGPALSVKQTRGAGAPRSPVQTGWASLGTFGGGGEISVTLPAESPAVKCGSSVGRCPAALRELGSGAHCFFSSDGASAPHLTIACRRSGRRVDGAVQRKAPFVRKTEGEPHAGPKTVGPPEETLADGERAPTPAAKGVHDPQGL